MQELIAPNDVLFLTRDWMPAFWRGERHASIASVTDIPSDILLRHYNKTLIETSSVAAKMSWASKRQTTRLEDMAYCLLGLFNVNMPLLYGEGSLKAFTRLQEEIMKVTVDHSLFAWGYIRNWGRQATLRAPHYETIGKPLFCFTANVTYPWSL